VLQFLFVLPAGSSRQIQVFERNSFLAVNNKGRVYDSFQVIGTSVDRSAWVVTKQTGDRLEEKRSATSLRVIVSRTRHSNPGNPYSITIAVLYSLGACGVIYLGLKKYRGFLRERRVIELRLNPHNVTTMRRQNT
jgi:hypothetical protein